MPRTQADILDEILVLAAQRGRAGACEALVERWHPRLLRHAVLVSRDPQRGADAVQEAWVSIIKKIRRLRDPARFGPWAYRIVTNKCRDEQRRAARSPGAGQIGWGEAVEARAGNGATEDPDGADEILRLRLAIRRLDPEVRALLSLRYVDQLTVPAIAGALGIPAGTVKSRLHGARAALRGVLDPDTGGRSGSGAVSE